MNIPSNQEYIEGEDPQYAIEELNYNELNKESSNYQTSAISTQNPFFGSKNPEIEDKYANIIKRNCFKEIKYCIKSFNRFASFIN